jgi:putative hemolysin
VTDFLFILIGLLFLALDLVTIATRSAYLQTNHARLLVLRETQGKRVNQAVTAFQRLPRLKASLNLILVLSRFALAGLALYWISRQPELLGNTVVLWASLALLVGALILFSLEWGLDGRISRDPEYWAIRLSPSARILMAALAILLIFSPGLSKVDREAEDNFGSVTEDELKTLVDAGQEEGVFEQDERRMIYSIFRLGETLAREIMVPRIDMLALDVNTSLAAAVDALLDSGHSRVPVYDENVDHTLGVLYAKDLLRLSREGGQEGSLKDLLRPAYFVPEAKHVDELLAEMQSQRIHIAIVVDEYGGVAGLVTLEDIVEEILGEIQDEYDQGEESPYQTLPDGDILFLGRIDVDDFNEIMGSELPKDEAETLGGYIYSRLGRVPSVGEVVQTNNLVLKVEQVSARRIRKVRAGWLQQVEPGDDKNGSSSGANLPDINSRSNEEQENADR